jgi:hypothetical protein
VAQSLARLRPLTGPTITQGFFSHTGEFSESLDHDGRAADCEAIKNVYPLSGYEVAARHETVAGQVINVKSRIYFPSRVCAFSERSKIVAKFPKGVAGAPS